MIGKIVGNYQITSTLARSEVGAIYRGQHLHLPREVVLNSIQLTTLSSSKQIQLKSRIRREAYILSQLEHPNIVRMHEFFASDDIYYLVLEYVQGMSLGDLLARQGVPTPAQAVFLFKQALTALDHAHGFNYIDESDLRHCGLIHRDLRPSNMLLDTKGRLKLTNFGIANILQERSGRGTKQSGTLIGPSLYMPPEQVRGTEIDRRSDIFSLGVALYEMLSGRLPFEKGMYGTDPEKGTTLADEEAIPIHDVIPELPASLSAIVMRAVRRSPSDRFQTSAEFLEALRAFEQQQIANGANRATSNKIPQPALIVAADPDSELVRPVESAKSFRVGMPATQRIPDLSGSLAPTQVINLAQNILPEGGETIETPTLFAALDQSSQKPRLTWVTAGFGVILLGVVVTAVILFSQQTPSAGLEVASAGEASGQALAGSGTDPRQSGRDQLPTSSQINNEVTAIRNARGLERQEKYEEAIHVYEDYIARNPYASETSAVESRLSQLKMLQSSLITADAAMTAGKYKLAVQQYSAVLRLKPDSQRAREGFTSALSKMPEAPSGPVIARPRPKTTPAPPDPTVQEPVMDPAESTAPVAMPAVRPRTLRGQPKAAPPALPAVDPPPVPKPPDGEMRP